MFGEVQSQLGNTMKSHHSTILDELLNTVISDENDQLMQNGPSYHHHNNNSSFLSESTVDSLNNNEVWTDINQQTHVQDNNVQVIGDESNLAMASLSQHWLPLELQMPVPIQMPSIHLEQQQQMIGLCPNFNVAQSVYENKPMDIDYSENPLAMSMPISSTCSDSNGDVVAAAGIGIGVGVGRMQENLDEMMEKSVERKQKRMAKNRESAAKSRAKKQKIDQEFFSNLKPRYQLRRTSSAKF
ncbi:hypothetical protein KIW84_022344 [Lathyrus oleraceus]|uniref:BZIP domain-containing protein n=1 Tax=Pisum sativum TaxID=3888 RepID=A0A9D5B564_PEA|nr:hypothetical protein KIW84_022344 [Pisum sativum]